MKSRNLWLLISLMLLTCGVNAFSQAKPPVVCKSTYALCTTAKCTSDKGVSDKVSCACDVKTGYSLGMEPCGDSKQSGDAETLKSRYYPVNSYARCSNDRPWAYCLDANCVKDKNPKNHKPTATCSCGLVHGQGDYVITTDKYTKDTCTTGIISSATVTQIDQATDYLETQDALPPVDFKVLNVQKK